MILEPFMENAKKITTICSYYWESILQGEYSIKIRSLIGKYSPISNFGNKISRQKTQIVNTGTTIGVIQEI